MIPTSAALTVSIGCSIIVTPRQWCSCPFRIQCAPASTTSRSRIALLKPRADDYAAAKATARDILLLVEVSSNTVRADLGRKARIYASASVPEYWVVDLNAQTVYVHRTPVGGAYQSRTLEPRGALVSGQFAPSVQFTVDELLG